MGRSGKLYCVNDTLIKDLLHDSNYEVRADGTVWTKVTVTGKVSISDTWRRAGSARRGYWTMKYFGVMLQIHRIIYAKFIGNLESDLVINHIDGNGYNNELENLEMVTQSVNNFHKHRVLNYPPVAGNVRLSWDIVRKIRDLNNNGVSYSSIKEEFKISKGHISQIVNNEIWIEGKRYEGI